MRLSISVDQKFWKNLRSKWPEPLEPTWKLTFKTPKYQEKVYWHHFDIKHCISWDFSFRTWFLKVMEFVVLFWSQLTPSHLGEIQNKPRKKNSKISVHTFDRSHISKNDSTLTKVVNQLWTLFLKWIQ